MKNNNCQLILMVKDFHYKLKMEACTFRIWILHKKESVTTNIKHNNIKN